MREALLRAFTGTILHGADVLLDRAAASVSDGSRTVKFLRGRARFDSREDDVWVASYPRSGTTWMQGIVHLLMSGARGFEFDHLSEVSPWWERALAWRSEAVDELARLERPRVFKTHLPRRWCPSRGRFIYVWRNPEDVAVSYFHLYRRYLRFEGTFDDFFERFLEGRVQYRSWFRHVAGWRQAAARDSKILMVSYEGLRADPVEGIGRIARFCGVTADETRLKEVARLSDFSRMKKDEDKFDHLGELMRTWGIRPGSFIREGKVGRGEGLLDAARISALKEARARAVPLPAVEWRLPDFLH